jgi:dTDP-4-amino-4,6-dideoxygalactose transaminase
MSLRHQLPAYSPLPFRALLGGARAALRADSEALDTLRAALLAHFGALDALLTDSGTSALTLALRTAARQRPTLPLALPAYGCYDIATAAAGAGAPVVLYDLDPATLAPDLDSLRRATERGAAAILVVHLYGIPVDLSPLRPIAADTGALLIEDAAQGAGGMLEGRPLGAHGSIAVLSFGRGKGTTGGSGGALLVNDNAGRRALAATAPALPAAAQGWGDLARLLGYWLLARPSIYALPAALPFLALGETIHHPPRPPGPIAHAPAGVLATTRALAEAEGEVRRRNAARLLAILAAKPMLRAITSPAAGEPGYLRFPVLAAEPLAAVARDRAARVLGIIPGYPKSLAELEGLGWEYRNRRAPFPGARELAARLFTLPTHGRLGEFDLKAVERWAETLDRLNP